MILSRWLMTMPDILIMVSSEMPELIGMSHRVLVLCAGHLTGTLEKAELSQEAIMRYATRFS